MRESCMRPMCVAALAAVICVRAVHAQNSPSVGGYRLGQTWARASGRTMPCNRNAGVGSDIPNAKFCEALNGVAPPIPERHAGANLHGFFRTEPRPGAG